MSDCRDLPLTDLLNVLEARGVRVSVQGGSLTVRPWGRLSEPEKRRLREEREAVVSLLSRPNPEPTPEPTPAPEPGLTTAPPPMLSDRQRAIQSLRKSAGLTQRGKALLVECLVVEKVPETEWSAQEIKWYREAFARGELSFLRRQITID